MSQGCTTEAGRPTKEAPSSTIHSDRRGILYITSRLIAQQCSLLWWQVYEWSEKDYICYWKPKLILNIDAWARLLMAYSAPPPPPPPARTKPPNWAMIKSRYRSICETSGKGPSINHLLYVKLKTVYFNHQSFIWTSTTEEYNHSRGFGSSLTAVRLPAQATDLSPPCVHCPDSLSFLICGQWGALSPRVIRQRHAAHHISIQCWG